MTGHCHETITVNNMKYVHAIVCILVNDVLNADSTRTMWH